MKKALCLLAVLTVLFTTACGNPTIKNGEEVIAEINGKKYTADELYKELKGQYGYDIVINWVDEQIAEKEVKTTDDLEKEVDEAVKLYLQYAEQYGMPIGDFAATYMGLSGITDEESLKNFLLTQSKLSLAIEKYVKEQLTDKEIEDYYNDNYKEVYTYREILIIDDDDADEKISSIKKALKDKSDEKLEDEFTDLAKKYSASDTASDGGLVKKAIQSNVDSSVWKKIKDLKNGKATTDEIKTDAGFYFVLRVSKDEAEKLDDIKDSVKDALVESKLTNDPTLSYDALTALRNKYKLAFYDSDLKKDYDSDLKSLDEYKQQLKDSEKED